MCPLGYEVTLQVCPNPNSNKVPVCVQPQVCKTGGAIVYTSHVKGIREDECKSPGTIEEEIGGIKSAEEIGED